MILIHKEDRIEKLDELLPTQGVALDIGCGNSLGKLYPQREFSEVVAINPCQPSLDRITKELTDHPTWEFYCISVQEYKPDRMFDVITMLHVAEHLFPFDLSQVLAKLLKSCCGMLVIETPEQFNNNERSAEVKDNPYEVHRSLVTREFLSQWGFESVFYYWQNVQFSNAVYVKRV